MEETVAQSRAQEEAKGGLLIVAARYGNLAASEEEAAVAVTPPYIDVAVPLQYLVSDSALVFDAGRSRCWLDGFYDPTMGAATHTNRLYVSAKFTNEGRRLMCRAASAHWAPLSARAHPPRLRFAFPSASASPGSLQIFGSHARGGV